MTSQLLTDALGRELCSVCNRLLPSDSIARELHLLRHTIEDIETHIRALTGVFIR